MADRNYFEIFKSSICHLVKDKGDMDFMLSQMSYGRTKSGMSIDRVFTKDKFANGNKTSAEIVLVGGVIRSKRMGMNPQIGRYFTVNRNF